MHCWMYCDWKHDVLVLWLEAWRVGTVAGVMICWYCDWSHDVLVLWLELWRVGTVTGVMTCWYCDWSHDVLVLWLESWRVGTVTGGRSHDVLVLWLESWCVGTAAGVMMCLSRCLSMCTSLYSIDMISCKVFDRFPLYLHYGSNWHFQVKMSKKVRVMVEWHVLVLRLLQKWF